jgi:hypothetical protein
MISPNATLLSIASDANVDLNALGPSWNLAGLNGISGAGGTLANAGGNRTWEAPFLMSNTAPHSGCLGTLSVPAP